ncbi:phosphate ABC transporter substrate-binding protein, PhoT family [Desulfatibacillum alkenivorans DSM 16219]|jgi:phosphate transport system substrate-binding protein|uniref:Phosphate-binding protein n=1 Tax=Desulfatibacillum alkenivorans DSM 16219 TaxID=1121393 RepID=A0A1M6LXN6_9BACT|nr:phosphate ABC transporter substrate-binding protein [Desulfatibacillum alkenivorans]SHJ76017.1 phosphate ABC transporter substrate-binding protein, PhoT family [Desulfatibacillum alkenivorans DSM 16219]
MKRFKLVAILVAALLCVAPMSALAGKLVIKGSTTVLPIAQKVGEAFMKQNPDVELSISGGGSGNGIKAIIDGTTDIADASRFIKDKEVKLAIEKGSYPVPFRVAYDCIVPIVHPSNTVKDLSLDQLKGIYKGDIKNWKEVGGPDLKIVVVSRDTSSGTYEVWESKVMNKERVAPSALIQASNGAVAQAVAGNKYAIGYIGLGYLNSEVKAVSANGVVGSKETTLNGSFPISRPLFMFTQGWPEGDTVNFLNFVLHPEKGQKLVEEAGYVPLY